MIKLHLISESFLVLKDYICKNMFEMIIERTKKEVIIRLLPSVDTDELQELANILGCGQEIKPSSKP